MRFDYHHYRLTGVCPPANYHYLYLWSGIYILRTKAVRIEAKAFTAREDVKSNKLFATSSFCDSFFVTNGHRVAPSATRASNNSWSFRLASSPLARGERQNLVLMLTGNKENWPRRRISCRCSISTRSSGVTSCLFDEDRKVPSIIFHDSVFIDSYRLIVVPDSIFWECECTIGCIKVRELSGRDLIFAVQFFFIGLCEGASDSNRFLGGRRVPSAHHMLR